MGGSGWCPRKSISRFPFFSLSCMGLLFYLMWLFFLNSPGVLFPKKEPDDSKDEDEEEDDSSEEDSEDEEPPPKRRY